eukprot:CAMPEP_0172776544 /NCGR_PEP_ID=MMETSP1074-20121228/200055_1 /TAXON_ID=2916 /ORGANISM="Ceratium fusus, Strain PA161109" /LENGTH=36 /DNA_ID= /DNA_START= /DNA_END= /DNA_ORIENTATION=
MATATTPRETVADIAAADKTQAAGAAEAAAADSAAT